MQQALPAAAPSRFEQPYPTRLGTYSVWEFGENLGKHGCTLHRDLVHDEFGHLQAVDLHGAALHNWANHHPHEVDDEAMAAYWPHEMLGRFAPPAPPQPPRIRAEILPADEGDFIGYAAELKISTARPLEGEPFYLLNIGANDLVYATRSELQGLVAAAAAVLSLQLTPCAGDVDLVDDADTLAALAEVLQ
ncbi:hypothetical protein [Roseateles cavernae]|uniref:hypothetical protein n=1 Tax=Roseateles cavernae TaxID=3153578 RepID=UPI0032E40E69